MLTNLKRSAQAVWEGTGLEGKGTFTTNSLAIESIPYTHKSRFQNEDGTKGTNPEELIAAAHAACFNMALSFQLNGAGYTATSLDTTASVKMAQEGFDYSIDHIELELKAEVPNITFTELEQLAKQAKETCPVSMALSAVEIILKVELLTSE